MGICSPVGGQGWGEGAASLGFHGELAEIRHKKDPVGDEAGSKGLDIARSFPEEFLCVADIHEEEVMCCDSWRSWP